MKGTFFHKQLEYSIELHGETWAQGDQINGQLSLRNHSNEEIIPKNIGCHLCLGTTKKIKAKQDDAYELQDSFKIPISKVAPNNTIEFKFKFSLKEDCLISESSKSLHIVCGDMSSPFDIGALVLAITPNKAILNFVDIFETFFKFKFKPFKNKKNWIEAKVIAPSSKEWTAIQGMNLKVKRSGENLIVNIVFKLKKMSYDASSVSTADSTLEETRELTKKQHTSFGDSPNQEEIKKVIEEIVSKVRIKSIV